jgi:predicted PurR-regulated permease PerM
MDESESEEQSKGRPMPLRLGALASALVILLVFVVILKSLGSFLQPLFVAVFFYYIGAPIAERLKKAGVPGSLAGASIVLLAVLVLAMIGTIVGVHVDDIRDKVPTYSVDLRNRAIEWVDEYSEAQPAVARLIREQVAVALGPNGVSGLAQRGAVELVGGFVGFLTSGIAIIVFLVFLTFEASSLPHRLKAAFGAERAADLLEVGRNTNEAIIRYVYVKGLASGLVSALSTGVFLVLRLDMAILWGALTFFGNFIPYVGSFVAVLLPSTIALLQFGSPGTAIGVASVLTVFQVLVAQFLEPRYAGRQLNLSPLVVILSLAFWGWLWGIIGLLLAIPVMVAIRLAIENVPGLHPVAALLSERPRRGRPVADEPAEGDSQPG